MNSWVQTGGNKQGKISHAKGLAGFARLQQNFKELASKVYQES